jgi:hypothetical protein
MAALGEVLPCTYYDHGWGKDLTKVSFCESESSAGRSFQLAWVSSDAENKRIRTTHLTTVATEATIRLDSAVADFVARDDVLGRCEECPE